MPDFTLQCWGYTTTITTRLARQQCVPKRGRKRRPFLCGTSKFENCSLAKIRYRLHLKMCKILIWLQVHKPTLCQKLALRLQKVKNKSEFLISCLEVPKSQYRESNFGRVNRCLFWIHLDNPLSYCSINSPSKAGRFEIPGETSCLASLVVVYANTIT